MNFDPQRLLDLYERGAITVSELEYEAIRAAREHPPETLVTALPTEVLEKIRDKAVVPENTEWRTCRIATYDRNVDPEVIAANERDEQARWRDGLAQWRKYFNRS
jgi:hypothetical protein